MSQSAGRKYQSWPFKKALFSFSPIPLHGLADYKSVTMATNKNKARFLLISLHFSFYWQKRNESFISSWSQKFARPAPPPLLLHDIVNCWKFKWKPLLISKMTPIWRRLTLFSFYLLIIWKQNDSGRIEVRGWLLDGVAIVFVVWLCCLTFFLSVENSRRRFTTESESDHCERKTEFVYYIVVSIGIIPSKSQCKSIKIKHILLVESRAWAAWCLFCLKSMYIFPVFRFVDWQRRVKRTPPFVYWLAYIPANCSIDEKLPFIIVYSCFWLYFIWDT
jgi:hypothetical protein